MTDNTDWKEIEGKKIHIETNSGLHYSGTVVKVESFENPRLIWITILDIKNVQVTFVHSEIKRMEVKP